MSTAAAAADAPPPAKGKKKLIIIIAAAVLLLAVAGGAAMFLLKKKPADADADGGEDHPAAHAAAKHGEAAAPTFVPLDPFTVNLSDRDAERYAQVGITLEIDDAHVSEQIKTFMPAIRNNILLAIADRSAADLMGRDGKARLAQTIRREASRALGFEVAEGDDEPADKASDKDGDKAGDDDEKKPKKKKAKKAAAEMPIKAVHFSNFIIQ